jgi:hypothetical protein
VAFADARPLGRLPGDKIDPLSIAAIGEVVQRTLRSSGGPALEGADAVPMRVSLMHGDRAKIEVIASHVYPSTSPSQMVAVLCHLALVQISDDQIVDTLSRLNGEPGKTE